MRLASKKLLLLFSSGMSVDKWDDLGMLSREVDVYSKLADHFQELWWYSYGENDRAYEKKLGKIHLFCPEEPIFSRGATVEDYNRAMLERHLQFFRQFDFVKTNQFSAARLGVEIKKRYGTKLIIRQGFWYPLKYRLLSRHPIDVLTSYYLHESKLYRHADAIIVTSEAARRRLVRAYSIDERRTHYLENAINTEVFKPYQPVRAAATSVLFIGRLAFQKNVLSLVKAISGLPVSLTIIGDGRYREQILRIKDKYSLNLQILPAVDNFDLPAIYNAHDIFVLPSRWEGNSKVLLEAMACGMPVIGADSWGVRDVIENGVNGILCGRSSGSIHEAIRSLISDPELRQKISVGARDRVLANNNLDTLIDKEVSIYSELT